MQHELKRLKKKGFTDSKFDAYLNNPNVKIIFNKQQLEELKALWYGNVESKEQDPLFFIEEIQEEPEETTPLTVEDQENIKSMSKDELDQYSIDTYGIDLDKRFTKSKMIEELESELKKYK